MTSHDNHERHLELRGLHNLRDIGGYATHDGQQTGWRILLHSDGLHNLEAAEQRSLLQFGLKSIIDLRYPKEIEAQPNPFATSSDLADYNPDDNGVVVLNRTIGRTLPGNPAKSLTPPD